jgi:hypothetical protein
VLEPCQDAAAPSLKPTGELLIRTKVSAATSRELSSGSGTRLSPGQVRRPPRSGCVRGAAWTVTSRGVARLLAVADLTVKTNIRTARRGTLGGATSSPTMQASLRACRACEILAADRSYARFAKLDKSAVSLALIDSLSQCHIVRTCKMGPARQVAVLSGERRPVSQRSSQVVLPISKRSSNFDRNSLLT